MTSQSQPSKHPEVVEALKNPVVAQLLQSVQGHGPVDFIPSKDSMWGSTTQSGSTTVEFAPTANPAEALAHELLHAELKADGYRQYTFAVAKRPAPARGILLHLLPMLDNELQHQRMADRFSALGLANEFFYVDSDSSAFLRVRRAVERMTPKKHSALEFLSQYVTALAPLGAGTETQRAQLKTFIKVRAGGAIAAKLSQVEAIFNEWRTDQSLDVAPFLKRILMTLDLGFSYWVGHGTAFPADGFFVGDSFEYRDAEGS